MDDPRGGAPAVAWPFLGRARESAALDTLLARERLVTVTGPGGCGKTRLVVETARAWPVQGFVELSGLGPDSDLAAALLAACGIREEPGREPSSLLAERLADAPGVVVLDTCEHVRTQVADVVADLLGRCATVRVVATSRVSLGLPEEAVLPLAGLEPEGAGADLFLHRARRVQPELPEDPADRGIAARICRSADGLPLAIELAAAHARTLPLSGIGDGMTDRMRFLVGGTGRTPRHGSLAASLAWSVGLVGEPAGRALRALSVLDGRFPLAVAVAVTGDRAALETLVDHSLVRFEPADGRYVLLDTVREYAAAARSARETAAARERLVRWAGAFARATREALEHGELGALRRVEAADAAVRSALTAALEAGGDLLRVAAEVAEDLAFGWSLRGRCRDVLGLVRRLAAASDPVPAGLSWAYAFLAFYAGDMEAALPVAAEAAASDDGRVRARALILSGMVQAFVDPAGAEAVLREATTEAAAVGDDWGQVEAAQCEAYTHLFRGRPAPAVACADSVLPVLRRLNHGQLRAWDAAIRAEAAEAHGRFAEAVEQGHLGLRLAVAAGEPVSAMSALLPLLRSLVATGRDDEAGRVLVEGLQFLDTHPGLGSRDSALLATAVVAAGTGTAAGSARAALDASGQLPHGAAEAALLLAVAHLAADDPDGARAAVATARGWAGVVDHRAFLAQADLVDAAAIRASGGEAASAAHEALALLHELGLRPRVAEGLDLVAALARDAGRVPAAARLHAAAARLRADLGATPTPLARLLAPPAGWDDDPALAGARAEGGRLGADAAVAYALRARGRRGRPRSGWASLTPTEREVAALVAAGLSNGQIGTRLLISPGTVRTHLRSVFAKLGVGNRAALAARAVAAEQ
ncbi:LuxR C-terminal-related transcriptional regulator [Pseudonocardia kujensis]|uniref:LuxR C-terminal-related transcriptional regulator n=1 Tax=Pseudonocardia kujensis TaxID=1128675 RepID=UPI001E428388|nr:LuxR C-terminal-related transcriptional regulator [Pseudonocardia kujensis]MCE0767903.1 LuxR C-terminal-related transcriptional regulator [Pseudonocardia kujensis]